MQLDESFAATLTEMVLAGIHRPYPNKIAHLLRGHADAGTPQELTPLFFGCFDWHSAVHGHWTLVQLMQRFPNAAWAAKVEAALAASFTPANVAGEIAYARTRPGFEMPYGVAWLLRLNTTLMGDWAATLEPLTRLRRDHFVSWLERLPAPIRTGEHSQTAFAMGFAVDAARANGDTSLEAVVADRAREFYATDTNAPIDYEPSAFDFLSPALAEADLLRRVMSQHDFTTWFDTFLPGGAASLHAVDVVDRSDGKLVHYDGLNLSRAWMLRNIAAALADDHRHKATLAAAATTHRDRGLRGLSSGEYAGEHWLPSFALAALSND